MPAENTNTASSEAVTSGGPEVMLVSPAVRSMVQYQVCGAGSALPARSVATTRKA